MVLPYLSNKNQLIIDETGIKFQDGRPPMQPRLSLNQNRINSIRMPLIQFAGFYMKPLDEADDVTNEPFF